jgi:integrase
MTTRRKAADGEGSCGFRILKDGSKSWWARCPVDPKNPAKRGQYQGGFRTQKEALEWKRKRTAEITAGIGINDKAQTVPYIVERWLKEASGRKRESTMIHYWSNFNCTIKPMLNIRLAQVTEERIEKFVIEAGASSKRGDGRAWARTSFNNVRAAMKWALKMGIIKTNPMAGIKFEYSSREKVRKSIPLEDYAAILMAANGKESQLIWRLLLACGQRKGEITALDVGDIDFRRGVIKGGKQATVESHGTKVRMGTKTGEEPEIRLQPAMLEALRAHCGNRPDHSPLFLGPQNGKRLGFGTLGRWWKRDVKAAGLEAQGYVIHQLRHTFATVALDKGADMKAVSQTLGHRSVVTTMNIYRDVSAATVDATNALVEAAVTAQLQLSLQPNPKA